MIKGIIFDLNGVISDTQKWHSRIESVMLKNLGVDISHSQITKQYSSVRACDLFKEVLSKANVDFNLKSLLSEKWFHIYDFLENNFEVIDGSIDLIKTLHSQGYPLVVASSSKLAYVRDVLNKIGVREYFDFIIGGDMVESGKPHPESFLFAASYIGVNPKHCLVIEDGVKGMEAAIAAGMYCVGLVSDKNSSYPTKNLVSSLSEINNDFLANLN